jgi:glycosyltransferase involved in cell wall biosynthesis
MPTLTVILPNYNHARYLPGAIDGILGQSRPPDEFLILDDASTDDSVAIIRSYADRHSVIRFLPNERNLGVIASQQRLLEASTGDYVYCAAADDVRLPGFFERAMALVERFPHAGLVMGRMDVIDEHDRLLGTLGVRRWTEPLFATPERYRAQYLEIEAPSHSLSAATILRRDALREIGWFPPPLGPWGDTFCIQAIGLKHGVCYVPEVFTRWRRLSSSFSAQSRSDGRHTLGLVAKAAAIMRSATFRDRFPEDYVRQFVRRYRRLMAIQELLGPDAGRSPRSLGFWLRSPLWLRRLPAALSLLRRGGSN